MNNVNELKDVLEKEERDNTSRGLGAMIGISWGIGTAVGWFMVPSKNKGTNDRIFHRATEGKLTGIELWFISLTAELKTLKKHVG